MCVLGDVGYEMHEDADAEYGVHVPSVSCLPARLSFLSKPDTEFGPKQKRRTRRCATGHECEGQTTRQQSRARHGPVTTVQSRRTGAVESNSRGLSLSKSIGRLVGHGGRRLAVSQHSDQAGCERIRPSMQVAVDGRRIARSPSSHGHFILTGPDLRLVPSAISALSVKPSSLTTSLSFSSHLSISLSTPPVLDGARQINCIDF